nr:MAG TPA: hypothetical protein [Caudoviricetes sp.]
MVNKKNDQHIRVSRYQFKLGGSNFTVNILYHKIELLC